MKATDILMDEHRVVERVLASLDRAASALERGVDVRPGFFTDAVRFARGFADGCHHRKEEGVLFEAMARRGMPWDVGPIAAMRSDHEEGRRFIRALEAAARRLEEGDAAARGEVVANARGYARLLQQHIQKEDGVLFPLADQVIPPEARAAVADGFERLEHEETGAGVHEMYLALAEGLERESGRV